MSHSLTDPQGYVLGAAIASKKQFVYGSTNAAQANTALNVGEHAVFLTDRAHTVTALLIERLPCNTIPSAPLLRFSTQKVLRKVATACVS